MDDKERLDWLERKCGSALVNDDAGHWAVASAGFQNVPIDPPTDVQTTFFIEKHEWQKSIREAIDAAFAEEADETTDVE